MDWKFRQHTHYCRNQYCLSSNEFKLTTLSVEAMTVTLLQAIVLSVPLLVSIFTARRYAMLARYMLAMALCLCVSVSVRHKSVFY